MSYKKMAKKKKEELTPEELERRKKKEGTAPKDKDTAARDVWKPKRERLDLSESESVTVQRVMEIAKRISDGESRMGLQQWIQENWQVGDRQARAYYSAAARYLIPENEEEYRRTIIQANLNRLETIVESTMRGQNYKDAISAIKEINKMLGVGGNSIEVATDGEKTAFRIKFE